MCSPAACKRCNRITWTGSGQHPGQHAGQHPGQHAGQHAGQVLASVPADRRCTCGR